MPRHTTDKACFSVGSGTVPRPGIQAQALFNKNSATIGNTPQSYDGMMNLDSSRRLPGLSSESMMK